MKVRPIMLNEQEATVLLNLLDVAVKAGGLGVAQNCLAFKQRLDQAFLSEEKAIEEKIEKAKTKLEDKKVGKAS